MQVSIIGAGPAGRWLALAAARAGFTVLLEDVLPERVGVETGIARLQHAAHAADGRGRGVFTRANLTEVVGWFGFAFSFARGHGVGFLSG